MITDNVVLLGSVNSKLHPAHFVCIGIVNVSDVDHRFLSGVTFDGSTRFCCLKACTRLTMLVDNLLNNLGIS